MKIDGLNKKQIKLLDYMWKIPTREELDQWLAELPDEDFRTCTLLLKMVMLEAIDEEVNSMDRFPEAIIALDKIINI